jgi:sec-independent protein translocase protein TatA
MIEDLLQPMHLLVIAVVAVLCFGPKKLPELGSGLAKGIRSFKEALKGDPTEPAPHVAETAPADKAVPVA